MFKRTLLATATAGMIAAGAMIGTTGTASADGVYFGGPGWSVGINDGHHWRPGRECHPVFRTERWWDRWGRPHFRRVYAGERCRWDGPRHDWRDWHDGRDGRGYGRYPGRDWRH